MDQDFMMALGKWTTADEDQAPDFIFLGLTAWYAFNKIGVDEFEKDIENALPLLETLANSSRVVWLNQVPLIPVNYPFYHQKEVVNEKVLPMNRLARRLLQDSGVVWWDDYAAAAAEYARACALSKRHDSLNYVNCDDDIHPGSGVVSTGTQYLLNRLCRSNGTTCSESDQILMARMGP